MIRSATTSDAVAVVDIYNYYIENTIITFEEVCLDEQEMVQRINALLCDYSWLVYEEDSEVIAYAYASPWRPRSAYCFAVETSVYVSIEHRQKGVGLALYQALIEKLRSKKFHTAFGGISLPNPASIHLHEKLGFKKVGHLKEVGYKFDQWIDVGYWQLMF